MFGRILAGALVGLVVGCGGNAATKSAPSATATPRATAGTQPLTGLPGGRARPALAIKVDNAPAARPVVGLNAADIVFETPMEGGYTRYLAVYQSQDAAEVGPIRSMRLVDPALLRQFGRPAFVYAGGIRPVIEIAQRSGLVLVGDRRTYRRGDRRVPYNLFTSTATQWAALTGPSPPQAFARGPASGVATTSAGARFSSAYRVSWRWTGGQWVRDNEVTQPCRPNSSCTSGGERITTDNLVVMRVTVTEGPYVEDRNGAHGMLIQTGDTGPVTVYRDGRVMTGTFVQRLPTRGYRFMDAAGNPILLKPGRTFVELVPR